MSTSTRDAVDDRQRARQQRSNAVAPGRGPVTPPKQRRPALAAVAVLLILGGGLVAVWMAMSMDSRVPVVVASHTIAPGTKITAADLNAVPVSASELNLITEEDAGLIIGKYSQTTIPEGAPIDGLMITEESPVGDDRAVVAVPLTPEGSPDGLREGDLVQVVRASGGEGTGGAVREISQGLVLQIKTRATGDLGGDGQGSATANLLVPAEVAKDVIDASANDKAGLALIQHGASADTPLEVAAE